MIVNKIKQQINITKYLGVGCIVSAGFLWCVSTVANNKFLPFTQACFRPEKQAIKNQENLKLLNCDSNERTAIILTPMYNFVTEKDVEFEAKITRRGTLKHLTNNLATTQNQVALAGILGVIGVGLTQYSISLQADKKYMLVNQEKENIYVNKIGHDHKISGVANDFNPVVVQPPTALEVKQAEVLESKLNADIAEHYKRECEALKDADKAKRSYHKQDVSKKQTDSSIQRQELIDSLTEALKNYESGWLYKILKMKKPIWVIGGQGAGKSTLASSLVLLRYYLFGWELEEIIDAHAQKNVNKAWKLLLQVSDKKPNIIGARNDYEGINTAFGNAIERWNDKGEDSTPTQSLVDEFTNLADASECSEGAARFVKHSLSDIRKTGERWIFISHFFTNTATGGKDGISKAKNSQTIQIERFTEDGDTPLNNVSVSGLTDDKGKPILEQDFTIPKWLTPESIHGHFTGNSIEF